MSQWQSGIRHPNPSAAYMVFGLDFSTTQNHHGKISDTEARRWIENLFA